MEHELISKKELLQRYSISYGALYRWKRKGLIPEDWFIRKATVTGQETFFPERLICDRVEMILEQKEESSLDELSEQFKTDNEPMLIIRTAIGEKVFVKSEIEAIFFVGNDGERRKIELDGLKIEGGSENE